MKHLKIIISALLAIVISSCSKDDVAYKLSTEVVPVEGGSISLSPSSASYKSGEEVTLTAIPAENFEFKNWTGGLENTTLSITVVMDEDKSITAIFEKKDTDKDGVTDDIDECPDTAADIDVNDVGCPLPQWYYNCYPVYDYWGYYLYDDCYWEYY